MMKLFLVCLQICLIVTYDIGKYDFYKFFYKLNFGNDYIYILISYIYYFLLILMYIIFLIIFKSYFIMKLNKSKKFNTDI